MFGFFLLLTLGVKVLCFSIYKMFLVFGQLVDKVWVTPSLVTAKS